VTGVKDGEEEPLIAIEYCGALPAGNQAWQRNGRAYSFGKSKLPYLYVAELGGYELDKNRNRKAPRMPNPAVPFSYLTYSMHRNVPVLPVFTPGPGSDANSRKIYSDEFADQELIDFVRSILLVEEPTDIRERLQKKVLSLVQKLADAAAPNRTLTAKQWREAYETVEAGESIVDYVVRDVELTWSKTTYISALTDSARALMDMSKEFAIGLTSANLPMCVIKKSVRTAYAQELTYLYDDLTADFVAWLKRDADLAICWVMGFKPRGDDARPDRGLPPLTRMLIGNNQDLLTVVYGPAPSSTWPMLRDDPGTLVKRNGLWESVLEISDALLVDSSTDDITQHGFVRSHWNAKLPKATVEPFFVSPKPKKIGENDVDTVLHTILAKFAEGDNIFEGMCNPPGGDWSGLSLLSLDRQIEQRWLSLPRVSGQGTKRPDHVFQIFNVLPQPVIMCVESKELPTSVEKDIGPQVIAYVANLMGSPSSVERMRSEDTWNHSERKLRTEDFVMVSAVAFVSDGLASVMDVRKRSRADLLFCFEFANRGEHCTIGLLPTSVAGKAIANFICTIDLSKYQTSTKLLT
jgi:hypothetical protein